MIIEVKCRYLNMVVYRVSRHKAAWLRAAQVTLHGAGPSSEEAGDSAEQSTHSVLSHIYLLVSLICPKISAQLHFYLPKTLSDPIAPSPHIT